MGFLDRLFGRSGSTTSGKIAKERLELVLGYDRAKISPQSMEDLKDDLISVISSYVDIDRDQVDIVLTRDGRHGRLVANIPLSVGQRHSPTAGRP
jgi:cell division topological specificity factor